MNPISRLAQIQQAKKEKEPEYQLLSERGMPRRREFIMQVNTGFILLFGLRFWAAYKPYSVSMGISRDLVSFQKEKKAQNTNYTPICYRWKYLVMNSG